MGRDMNIGIPTIKNLTRPIEVQNLEGVIAATKAVEDEVAEIAPELRKIKTGTGLTVGVDLDEEVE